MNAPKLEDFIKTYVENKAKSETREGYANWLMKNGINAEKIYNDAEAAIASDYARAQSGYGKNAEGLEAAFNKMLQLI